MPPSPGTEVRDMVKILVSEALESYASFYFPMFSDVVPPVVVSNPFSFFLSLVPQWSQARSKAGPLPFFHRGLAVL